EHDGQKRTGDCGKSPQEKLCHVDEIDLGFDRREIDTRLEGADDGGEQPADEPRPVRCTAIVSLFSGRRELIHQRRPISSPTSNATPPAIATAVHGLSCT